MDVSYCPRCNQLFQKVARDVCTECMRELDQMYEQINRLIRRRENREATIEDIEASMNIAKEDVIRVMRLGRINLNHYPNLGYPCETENCDQLISVGRICSDCIDGIQNGLEVEKRQKEKEQRKKEEERKRYRTYETLDDR